jgi:hypothetical protein
MVNLAIVFKPFLVIIFLLFPKLLLISFHGITQFIEMLHTPIIELKTNVACSINGACNQHHMIQSILLWKWAKNIHNYNKNVVFLCFGNINSLSTHVDNMVN